MTQYIIPGLANKSYQLRYMESYSCIYPCIQGMNIWYLCIVKIYLEMPVKRACLSLLFPQRTRVMKLTADKNWQKLDNRNFVVPLLMGSTETQWLIWMNAIKGYLIGSGVQSP